MDYQPQARKLRFYHRDDTREVALIIGTRNGTSFPDFFGAPLLELPKDRIGELMGLVVDLSDHFQKAERSMKQDFTKVVQ